MMSGCSAVSCTTQSWWVADMEGPNLKGPGAPKGRPGPVTAWDYLRRAKASGLESFSPQGAVTSQGLHGKSFVTGPPPFLCRLHPTSPGKKVSICLPKKFREGNGPVTGWAARAASCEWQT